jgi:hypothetical protein
MRDTIGIEMVGDNYLQNILYDIEDNKEVRLSGKQYDYLLSTITDLSSQLAELRENFDMSAIRITILKEYADYTSSTVKRISTDAVGYKQYVKELKKELGC